MDYSTEWEIINEDTDRMRVPNGWLVRTTSSFNGTALVVVSDVENSRGEYRWFLKNKNEDL